MAILNEGPWPLLTNKGKKEKIEVNSRSYPSHHTTMLFKRVLEKHGHPKIYQAYFSLFGFLAKHSQLLYNAT